MRIVIDVDGDTKMVVGILTKFMNGFTNRSSKYLDISNDEINSIS